MLLLCKSVVRSFSVELPVIRRVLSPIEHADVELILDNAVAPLNGFMTKSNHQSLSKLMFGSSSSSSSSYLTPFSLRFNASASGSPLPQLGQRIQLLGEDNSPITVMKVADVWQDDASNISDLFWVGGPFLDGKTSMSSHALVGRYGISFFKTVANAPIDNSNTKILGVIPEAPLLSFEIDEISRIATENVQANSLHFHIATVGSYEVSSSIKCNRTHIIALSVGRARSSNAFGRMNVDITVASSYHRVNGIGGNFVKLLLMKNYGCTHVLLLSKIDPIEWAQLENFAKNLGITVLSIGDKLKDPPSTMAYVRALDRGEGDKTKFHFQQSDLETLKEIEAVCLPPSKRGLCIYLVGLSSAGKSTVCRALSAKLHQHFISTKKKRELSILDGDVVRRNLSAGLGFSAKDRSANVRRIGFVAAEIVKHNGVVLCANIAPFNADRMANREAVNEAGGTYVEVFVDASLKVCQERDTKGLYENAKQGKGEPMTGAGDTFEPPISPEIRLTPDQHPTPETGAIAILDYLIKNKLIEE